MKPAQAIQVYVSIKPGVRFHSKSRSLLLLPQLDPQSTRGKLTTDRSIRGRKCNRAWLNELPAGLDDGLMDR